MSSGAVPPELVKRLPSSVNTLELIGKHIDVQAFREKVEVEVSGSLAERLARAKARVLD